MKNVALVGFTGSEFDTQILADSFMTLERVGALKKLPVRDMQFDAIDLNKGRDFLQESNKYKVVIFFYLFIGTTDDDMMYDPLEPSTKTSPKGKDRTNWINRLINTDAEHILMFGGPFGSEIDGKFIGELPGYRQYLIDKECGLVWEYHKDAA